MYRLKVITTSMYTLAYTQRITVIVVTVIVVS